MPAGANIGTLKNWSKSPSKRHPFFAAPDRKKNMRLEGNTKEHEEQYSYVKAFFQYAAKEDIEKLEGKLEGLVSNAGMPENAEYLPHYIAHIGKAKTEEWREAILKLLEEYKGKKRSKFLGSLYDTLPSRFSKSAFQMEGGGSVKAFPVDQSRKAWTMKKKYKKWVGKLKRVKTVRRSKKQDLCIGADSICEGNLGIPRKYMPQFESKTEIRQFTNFIRKAYGIQSHKTRKAAGELRPSQKEISRERVESLINENILGKVNVPILISGDDYVIDGHHRWAAYRMKAPSKKIPAVVIDAPIKDVLGIAIAWGAKHQEF